MQNDIKQSSLQSVILLEIHDIKDHIEDMNGLLKFIMENLL